MASATSWERDPPVAAIAGLSGIVLDLRLIAAALTVLELVQGQRRSLLLGAALAIVIATSYLPLRRWDRLGPVLARHPSLIAIDVIIAVAVLMVVSVHSPFLYYAIGTALLAGVLYSWRGAAVFSTLLILGHWAALAMHAGASLEVSFQTLIGLPGLYPLVGASGAALRRVLERQVAAAAALRDTAEAAAAAEERVRLAREMHDSLGKSLRGIAIAAAALPHWIHQRPDRAAVEATALADVAESAASEARMLIGALRADTTAGPTGQAVRRMAQEWAAERHIALTLGVDDGLSLAPEVRHELLRVLTEALENAARHAHATTVTVSLRGAGRRAVLTVTDDGVGFDPPRDLTRLQRAGHYGLVGMHERARRAGGGLRVTARRGAGAVVEVVVPAGDPRPHAAVTSGDWASEHPEVGSTSPGPPGPTPDSVSTRHSVQPEVQQRR